MARCQRWLIVKRLLEASTRPTERAIANHQRTKALLVAWEQRSEVEILEPEAINGD